MVADAESIAGLKSLGPKSAAMLAAAGITAPAQLRRLGAVAAYVKVNRAHSGVSLNLLWALESALTGLPWQEVARRDRARLLLALDAYQRSHPPALVDDTPSPAAAKNLARARRYALALPAATEQPHHAATSFRVSGKIFATVPPDACSLNLFVDDMTREQMVATWPDAFENLLWGGKVAGLRADLQRADPATLERLLLSAWQRKAPRRLLVERDAPATVATRRARPGKKSADCA